MGIFRTIFFVFFVLGIYGVNLRVLPIDLYRVLYVVLFGLIFLYLCTHRITLKLPKEWITLLYLFYFSASYSLFVAIYTGSAEYTFFRMNLDYILTITIVAPAFFVIFNKLTSGRMDVYKLTRYIIGIVTFQAIVMLAMLISPKIQTEIFSFIGTNGAHERYQGDFRFRAIGLTGFASYSMAMCQSFGLYLFHVLWSYRQTTTHYILSIISFLLILISAVVAARTSVIFIVPLFFYYFYLVAFTRNGVLKYKLRYALGFSSIFIFFSISYFLSIESSEVKRMVDWVFEVFINFVNSGTFSTSSSDSLKTLFFVPQELTIIFGDGKYLLPSGEYYMHTDVGFLRVLLFGGILGSLIFYAPFVYLYYLFFRKSKNILGYRNSIAFAGYSLLIFVVNIKGSVFFDGFITQKLIIIFTFSILLFDRQRRAFS